MVLGNQDWIESPETRAVMAALGAGQALFVGGCVRNAVLGTAAGDVDIATTREPQEIMQRLRQAGIKAIPTGIDHGTVTAVVGERSYEITTLRRDVETDGRRAVVAFTADWREDALRRDFTINTLLADMQGRVFDPLGTGLADAQAGRIIFVGDAAARIAEDALRILRFFRFYGLYAQGAPDKEALAACRAAAAQIDTLSRERVTQEFLKILSADNAHVVLDLMLNSKVLSDILKPFSDEGLFERLCVLQHRYNAPSLAARLYALGGFDKDDLQKIEEKIIFTSSLKKEIKEISKVSLLSASPHEHAIKTEIYRHGRMAVMQALLIAVSKRIVPESEVGRALPLIRNWEIPKFPVSGADLIAQGMSSGPALGHKLKELEDAWVRAGFTMP
ncbi:MAG: CCA tRNA nucleotidyltransferase [Alphaproteobacteria bacterium]|nr:CCA tRNA nucleotidyltransferase [Alphaproteobacteria bacterium]